MLKFNNLQPINKLIIKSLFLPQVTLKKTKEYMRTAGMLRKKTGYGEFPDIQKVQSTINY